MNLFVERLIETGTAIIVIYMILYATFLFLSVLFGALQLYEKKQMDILKNELKHDYYMPISIIVPAFNEEVTIVDNVKNLLTLDYKLYEIIIVDDGSTDKTAEKLLETFPFVKTNRPVQRKVPCEKIHTIYEATVNRVKITIVQKENGGRADALNAGINASQFPYFVTLDADSVLQQNSLEKIIQPVLADDRVIAVGGMVRAGQGFIMENGKVVDFKIPWNPVVAMQTLEYDRTFLASRIFLDLFNGNLIISGAYGLFKKDIVIAVGGYRKDVIGEDMELVMRLHTFMLNNQREYRMRYLPESVCLTQCPPTLKDLMKQRRRWHIGLFQAITSYPMMLTRYFFKPIGFISYIYYGLFELIGPFIELFGIFLILLALFYNILNIPFMINLILIYTGYMILLTLTSFCQRIYIQGLKLHPLDILKALVMVALESLYYRQVLSFVRVTALLQYRKRKNEWGSIKRTQLNSSS